MTEKSHLVKNEFTALDTLAHSFYTEHAKPAGFRDSPRSLDRELMLIMSECFECFEDVRRGKLRSEHIPDFSCEEEEMADVIIRVLEACYTRGWRIGAAVQAKFEFNKTRPFKHGKEF